MAVRIPIDETEGLYFIPNVSGSKVGVTSVRNALSNPNNQNAVNEAANTNNLSEIPADDQTSTDVPSPEPQTETPTDIPETPTDIPTELPTELPEIIPPF